MRTLSLKNERRRSRIPVESASEHGGSLLDVTSLTVEVSTERGWLPIVSDVSLHVGRGETVGLVGESGSGKTVTSLAIMGLLPRNARISGGSVALAGRELVGLSEREYSDVRGEVMAMIFQEPRRSLNPAFTVGDQVAESLRRHRGLSRRESSAVAKELFELVEIPKAGERLRQYPHQFSGGMCQRVMLAMALACQPEILIADEPTTALDVTVQRQMLELLARLQGELEFGTLLITHDLGVVAETCSRVMVMYAGQVVEHAGVDDIFHDPQHPYTSALLGTVVDPMAGVETLSHIKGVVPPPHRFPTGCRFQPRCAHALDDLCGDPVELRALDHGRASRCARVGDLRLEGVRYE
ncbi:ABC transporter ATP-binding protein [Acrocarpospora pleiomorpha]|uniref:ABC transporter ATP-binding protein n=1 Tax=Acrocarpospora pleiomorpha TaxID=90975 RepID=A0A5M3XX87_9ACTN|nr:ABC transporter ATP-binding protein [Acrocarpospora pleiomorpha]GES25775.1 ABC transporter ATP-binding protein [Acrocarpospora pleiomorpha]